MKNINSTPSLLIVDDEEGILRLLISEISLERPQYKVTTTKHSSEALEWIKDKSKKYDIIITDLVMPIVDGLQLIHAASEYSPESRIFLMSGYTNLADQMGLFELGVEKILLKPLKIDQLINLIENPEIQHGISHKEMIAVRVSEMLKRKTNPCDLYLLLGKEKIIKVFVKLLPIEKERLTRLLKNDVQHLYAKKNEIMSIPSQFYVPIRIATILLGKSIPCELYYQTKDKDKEKDKHKLLLKAGTNIEKKHFDILAKHKVKKLYLCDKDEGLYQHYLEEHIDEILKLPNVSPKEKSEVAFGFMETSLVNVFSKPNYETIESLKKAQATLQGYLSDDKNSLEEIIRLSKEEKGIYAHSIAVASLSYAIIIEMANLKKTSKESKSLSAFSFESKEVKDIIFLGGLLHDIGKTILNMSNMALSPTFDQSSQNAIEIYQSHPKVGYERLKNIKGIPPKALEIVLQHEELCDGSGFPNGLARSNISIYTQLITLSNKFDHLFREQNKNDSECILALKLESAKYNKQLLFVFEKMFGQKK